MLEGARVRLEMSIEQMRKENRREVSQREEELEEVRLSAQKKIKGWCQCRVVTVKVLPDIPDVFDYKKYFVLLCFMVFMVLMIFPVYHQHLRANWRVSMKNEPWW